MALQETFIRNLRYFRRLRGLTQNELTLRIDMGCNYINGVEQGTFFPKPDVIDRIALALDVRAVQLFDDNASPQNAVLADPNAFADKIAAALCERIRRDMRRDFADTLREVVR